jgi:ribonucleoside-diphosphate reductase alpha chain
MNKAQDWVWRTKYRYAPVGGEPEATIEDTWWRVARAVAEGACPVATPAHRNLSMMYMDALRDFKFLPAGRILAGAGTGRRVTMMNCYGMGTIPDSLDGIFSHLKEAALTLQQGGGIGYDFSTIRPKGELVRSVDSDASGPLPFMDTWDAMCRTIMSAGCLDGDTVLTTDHGFFSICRIVEERLPVRVKTHLGWRKITSYFDNGVARSIRVTFEHGRSIVCTPTHRFHTINEDGAVVKKSIGEMSEGDTCLFPTRFFPGMQGSYVASDLSYVLGHYWANGHTRYRTYDDGRVVLHHVSISFANSAFGQVSIQKCQSILDDNKYLYKIVPGDGDCTIICLYNPHAENLVALAGAKPLSHEIQFPDGVDPVPFVAGYFDGGGSWQSNKKGAILGGASEGMIKRVQDILMDLGIPSRYRCESRPNGWRDMHSISISGAAWQGRFLSLFGPWLSKIRENVNRRSHSFVYPPEALKSVEWSSKLIRRRIMPGQNIGYHTFQDVFPDAELLKFGGIRIREIEEVGDRHVYDIEVEDTHSYVAEGISVSNSRRGAMMACLRADHPDIEDFIRAKREPGRLTNFNVSVLVPDAFMHAIEAGESWDLVWEGAVRKTLKARELWDLIMRSTYEYAEPGVIFVDRLNALNNINYCETLSQTNPCGEQPLPPYGACCLGSINLAALVQSPFTVSAWIDTADLRALVGTAIDFLDNVVETSGYPLEAQRQESTNKRRVGLGVTGLADALAMCGYVYGSKEALEATDTWLEAIADAAYARSAELARDRGVFPLYAPDKFNLHMLKKLSARTLSLVAAHGLRNSHVLSIAPTGTISMFAGNVSSGIEPIFSLGAERKFIEPDGSRSTMEVYDWAWEKRHTIGKRLDEAEEKRLFVTAQDLPVEAHLATLAIAQKWCDSAVSKTINLPAETSFEDFKAVYSEAYARGCKGCTTYRPSGIRGAVLTPIVEGKKPESEVGKSTLVPNPKLSVPMPEGAAPITYGVPRRPDELPGLTYKLKWPRPLPGGDSVMETIYLTVNDGPDGKPFEIFMTSSNVTHHAWWSALTRLASANLRRGDYTLVVEELLNVFDPAGGAIVKTAGSPKPMFHTSLPALVGATLRHHLGRSEGASAPLPAGATVEAVGGSACPKCEAPALVIEEGCRVCKSCGYSSCG